MTISIYTGTPGSGKSFHAAREVHDCMAYRNMAVISNYEMNVRGIRKGAFNYVENGKLTADLCVSFAVNLWADRKFKEDGILLVIDEAQLLFNSRNWQDADRMKWLEFFSQHRKYGYRVILIAQDAGMIDKQFRSLIEYECNHRKLGNYGLFGAIAKIVFMGEMFYSCRYYFQQHRKLDGQFIRYSRKIAKLYNSYTTFQQIPAARPLGRGA